MDKSVNSMSIEELKAEAARTGDDGLLIYASCRGLAGYNMDGASVRNGIGFNKFDSDFGMKMAAIPYAYEPGGRSWTPGIKMAVYKLIQKYRNQLAIHFGIAFSDIKEPEPANVIAQQRAEAAPRPGREPFKEITLVGGNTLRFDFRNLASNEFFALKDRIKAIPGREFFKITDPKDDEKPEDRRKILESWWTIPLNPETARLADAVAREYKFTAKKDLIAEVKRLILIGNRMEEASRQTTAEIEIEGFGGDGLEPFPFQKAGILYGIDVKRVAIFDDMGLGKQQPVDAHVLTQHGWHMIGDLQPGDEVIGSNGAPCKVLRVFPQGIKPSYRVRFSDGSYVEAGPEHLWTVRYRMGGRRWQEITLTTDQLRERPVLKNTLHGRGTTQLDLSKTVLYLPMLSEPVDFGSRELDIPPYTMGYLIANGSFKDTSVTVTTHAEDATEVRDRMLSEGMDCSPIEDRGGACRFHLRGIKQDIRSLKLTVLSRNKFIPVIFQRASPKDRIALLQGLMDGDGSVSRTKNRLVYHTTSECLADDVAHIVECLGGIALVRTYDRTAEGKPVEYQVRMRLPETIKPFSVARKAERYQPGRLALPVRTVTGVEYVRDVESVCIAVDSPDHLYVTEHAILTHNTIQALGILHYLKAYPALIIVPRVVKINWQRETLKWIHGCRVLVAKSKISAREIELYKPDIVIINYDILAKAQDELAQVVWKAIICDEAHRLKNPKAQRTMAAKTLAKSIDIRMLLTGTPVLNRPPELISLLDILGQLKTISPKGAGAFLRRYFPYEKMDNTDELHKLLRKTCMVRRTKEEVLKDLPPILRSVIPLDIDNEREYREAEEDIISWIYDNAAQDQAFLDSIAHLEGPAHEQAVKQHAASAAERARRAEVLVRIGKLKLLTARGKLKAYLEYVHEFLESGEKLIIFCIHREIEAALLKIFPNSAAILGGQNDKVRQANVDRFQNDPDCKLAICAIMAAGEGITLTAASNVDHFELAWTPAAHQQGDSRAHRIGQLSTVNSRWFIAEGTIEEDIAELLDEKQRIVSAISDGVEIDEEQSLASKLMERLKARAAARMGVLQPDRTIGYYDDDGNYIEGGIT